MQGIHMQGTHVFKEGGGGKGRDLTKDGEGEEKNRGFKRHAR